MTNESQTNRGKHQRKSESDIIHNLVSNQQQQQQNTSPVHYPPSIPNTSHNSNNAINYNASPSKTPQITVKQQNKSLFFSFQV